MTQSAAMRKILAREGRMHEVDIRKVQRSLPQRGLAYASRVSATGRMNARAM